MKIGGGDLAVPVVDPKDPDVVYVCSIVAHKSTDGGKTWHELARRARRRRLPEHLDQPDEPATSSCWSATRGRSSRVNGGADLELLVQPAHRAALPRRSPTAPSRTGSARAAGERLGLHLEPRQRRRDHLPRVASRSASSSTATSRPTRSTPNIVYGAGRNEVSRFHWDTGQVQNVTPIPLRERTYRTERTEPIAVLARRPASPLLRGQRALQDDGRRGDLESHQPRPHPRRPGVPAERGNDGGRGTRRPPSSAGRSTRWRLSFRSAGTLWAGTDDGLVWITRDEGKSWTNVTPPELAPWSKVTQISTPRSFDDDTAYVSVSRFRVDDLRPLVFRTHDGGQTWETITSGAARRRARRTRVRDDPVRPGPALRGDREGGLRLVRRRRSLAVPAAQPAPHLDARSLDPGRRPDRRHPRPRVLDARRHLAPAAADGRRSTRSRGPPLRARPGVPRASGARTPTRRFPPDEPMAANPPDGAVIDYFLGRDAAGPVTLGDPRSRGALVRRYRSDDPPEPSAEELRTAAGSPLLGAALPQSRARRRACTASCGTCTTLRPSRPRTATRSRRCRTTRRGARRACAPCPALHRPAHGRRDDADRAR